MKRTAIMLVLATLALAALACTANPVQIVDENAANTGSTSSNTTAPVASNRTPDGEQARVIRIADGDTITVVTADGEEWRVRYLGINTTEVSSNDDCSQEATAANAALVEGQTVTLVPDAEEEDRYGRKLRYIYVGNVHVNAELVRQGWAEAVLYEPNDAHWEELVALEEAAARNNVGCHGISDIFDDGSKTR